MHLPADISVSNAKLPAAYEAAKTALANCAQIDECQEWANKAEALASYAKQADDDTLRKMADRIQARAIRRCGELLKQFDGRGGDRSKNEGTHTFAPSQRQAATDAGMSDHQRVQAVRVANVPADVFERETEGETPPTVTKLAEMGTQKRAPQGFTQATTLIGTVRRFAEFCRANDPEVIANAVYPYETAEVRRYVETIDAWLDRFVVNLPEK